MAKVRPFYDLITHRCFKNRPNSADLSIDESMLPYYGKNSSKQRIQNKPVRSGYKMWVLAESSGYIVNFDPYQGAKNGLKVRSSDKSWGLGENVILSLLDIMPQNTAYRVFMDNFFTSFRLLEFLSSNNIKATGTLRENRLGNCTIAKKKEIDKMKRGESDYRCTKNKNLTVVGWKDNRSVYVASNCDSIQPLSSVQRWNREVQSKVSITQPFLIDQYNKGMGGVDRADQNIASYRISIKSKKWWWALFAWIPDMVVQNAWILYRNNKTKDDPYLDLLAFRRSIVNVYFKKYAYTRNRSSRPRGRILPAKRRVSNEIRYDRIDPYQHTLEKQKRCANCGKNTRKGCNKCAIGLHDHCFEEWHGII